jgi:hypothetical protein
MYGCRLDGANYFQQNKRDANDMYNTHAYNDVFFDSAEYTLADGTGK